MNSHVKAVIGGTLVGLALVGFTATPSRAQTPPQSTMTHEQMHQMMDTMHGQGTSERMHQAMGADAERLMDQCVGMMNMMNGNMSGMMNGQNGESMQEMMRGMMGQ